MNLILEQQRVIKLMQEKLNLCFDLLNTQFSSIEEFEKAKQELLEEHFND